MTSNEPAQSSHLAALCSSLSRLTTEQLIEDWDEASAIDTVEECCLTLVGKILSDPSINLPAFQTTLRKAWRIDSLEWSSERMLIKAVQHLGEIRDVKLDSKEGQLFGWTSDMNGFLISAFPVASSSITRCTARTFPTWKIFYGPPDTSEQAEEIIPETPPSSPTQPTLVMHSTALVAADQKLKGVQSSPFLIPIYLIQLVWREV